MVKISKKAFIQSVADKNNLVVEDVNRTYEAIVSGICDVVSTGKTLTLINFGSFYLQKHKGHPIQFSDGLRNDDYVVFKFSASGILNKQFRDAYASGEIKLMDTSDLKINNKTK